MSNRTRNTLGWWAIAACTATTVGAIVTTGTDASSWFAVATWLLAIVAAFLSRGGRAGHDAEGSPPSHG